MILQQDIVIPNVKIHRDSTNYAKFVISPLDRGYGVTVGNSLRRVLLSSLEGAAVTEIRIKGIDHEYSAIPGVREDVLMIILQLKQLRLVLKEGRTAELHLHAEGAGNVSAAEIKCPENVEIINPDLYLFNIDNSAGSLDMTLFVEKGRGYIPAVSRVDPVNIGVIPLDAIFSPIVKVNWEVTNMFYYDRADYDRLVLEIWTDGTITPEYALHEATKIIINQFRYIFGVEEEMPKLPKENSFKRYKKIDDERFDAPLETLDLSLRVFNPLHRNGYTTIRDVLFLADHPEEAKKMVRNFGDKGIKELQTKLQKKGYWQDKSEPDSD